MKKLNYDNYYMLNCSIAQKYWYFKIDVVSKPIVAQEYSSDNIFKVVVLYRYVRTSIWTNEPKL